jgi:hypothetical protein
MLLEQADPLIIILVVLGLKAGGGLSQTSLFLIVNDIFPIKFKGTIFGLITIIAAIFSVPGPLLAELPDPIPLIIYLALAIISLVAVIIFL